MDRLRGGKIVVIIKVMIWIKTKTRYGRKHVDSLKNAKRTKKKKTTRRQINKIKNCVFTKFTPRIWGVEWAAVEGNVLIALKRKKIIVFV